jgi:NhaP-type Na+/H+ or K+/H+ antiporter
MDLSGLDNASLTVALAMLVGVSAQAIARHLRIPGIVLLLAAGVVMGPDVAGLVRPASLSHALHALVGFAVAIILFEGGLNLNLRLLRSQARPIRRLVTLGALVTAAGGALAARGLMGWSWRVSVLFGTLVIVTGPTVITPLLRRIKVRHNLETVLEAEGIFIDAVGATIAVVALDVALAPSGQTLGAALLDIAGRIGVGTVVGLAGGLLLAALLHWRKLIPDGLENILSLAFAIAVSQVASAILPESGIAAAIVAGLVVGNVRSHALRDLREFKEQLTVLFIATLFVLLAADVRVADVRALGGAGALTVVVLMLVVRPLDVALCSWRTSIDRRERLFLMWLAPRGIVAAAIASLCAHELSRAHIPGGAELRALVFLVIAVTVTVQGLTGGLVARLLGVRRAHDHGYLILGVNAVALAVADALRRGDEEVVFIDANPTACRQAEEAGFRVLYGNGLEERTLVRAHADSRRGCLALTPNEEVNFLFAREIHDKFRGPAIYLGLQDASTGITAARVDALGARIAFGGPRQVGVWATRLRRGDAAIERWRLDDPRGDQPGELATFPDGALPLAVTGGGRVRVAATDARARKGDELDVAIAVAGREQTAQALAAAGWVRIDAGDAAAGAA